MLHLLFDRSRGYGRLFSVDTRMFLLALGQYRLIGCLLNNIDITCRHTKTVCYTGFLKHNLDPVHQALHSADLSNVLNAVLLIN